MNNDIKLSILALAIVAVTGAIGQSVSGPRTVTSPSAGNAKPDAVVLIDQEPNHKLVLATDEFRVFDVHFQPGMRSLWHAHGHDSVLVTLDGANVPSEEPGKPVLARPPIASGHIYYRGYGSTPYTHRITNTDNKAFHILDIELSQRRPYGHALAALAPEWQAVLENDRVRVSKVTLAPGAATQPTEFKGARLYVPMRDGSYVVKEASGQKGYQAFIADRGNARSDSQPRTETFKNVGVGPLELVVIEVK